MPIVCVDCYIIHEDTVLLVRRTVEPACGQYWVPGGRIRKLEPIDDAAVRVARTEVGLRVIAEKTLGVSEHMFQEDPFGHNKWTHTLTVNVRCRTEGGRHVKLDRTSDAYAWVPYDDPLPIDGRVRAVMAEAVA